MDIHATLKRSQFLFFLKMELFDKDYKENKKKMKSALKCQKQIKAEMKTIANYWKCKPFHYIRYELFNKNLSQEELLDYIPPYYHYNYHFPAVNSGIDLQYYKDKLKLFHLFSERQIPTPDVIGIINKQSAYDINLQPIDFSSILLSLSNEEKLFIKPTDGAGGTGIVVIKKQDNKIYHNNNEIHPHNLPALFNQKSVYVIQKGIVQREDINQINASSVNTLRIITQWREQNPVMSVCVMRIGRNGKDLDNSHQGGLSIPVNVENGSFGNFATAEHGGGQYFQHPDSGFIFNQNRIENWTEIKNTVIGFAKKIPELKEIAWDIAITSNGVIAIELNLGYGLTHLQCCCGGMRRTLQIFPNYEL